MKPNRFVLGAFLAALLGAWTLPSGCRTTTYVDHGVVFEPHEVVTGSARSQTVLPGFLLGGPMADLAVVSVDPDGDRRVRVYAFDDASWVAVIDAPLRPGVLFVDVANIGGRDRLLTCESGRLNWFDPDSASERALVDIATRYDATNEGEVPHVDVTRDVNHDGRDDLVLPDVDGFWISTQSSEGTFTDPVKTGPPEPFLDEIHFEEQRSYGEMGLTARTIPWYLSRVHELDYDRDGRSDLVFWNKDHFEVYLQDERGSFDPVAETFTTGVPFDSDGVYSHSFGYDDESTFSLVLGCRKRTERTVLHSFHDVNGDTVADLVTHSLEGRSLLKLRTTLRVHLGESTPDGTRFAQTANSTLQPRGSQPAGYALQQLKDLDGDGQLEVMLLNVDTGIFDMFQVLLARSIDLDLEFHRLGDDAYPGEPIVKRRIRPDSDLFGGRGPFFPTVLLGDVNGDGLSDLLAGQSWDELRLFIGVPGPELFAEHPQKLEVALPANERNARILDLNADGMQDVLIHHPSLSEPHRLTMLIAR